MPRFFIALAVLLLAACARKPAPAPPAGPAPDSYAALPDTLVCVVDRTTRSGLRDLTAKRRPDGSAVLLVAGETTPLERIHPVGIIAGYAGAEGWLRSAEPILLQGRRYVAVPGERRIPRERLQQSGEYRAIPLFADPDDATPPQAVYLPTRPGCIFQAYVREDLAG